MAMARTAQAATVLYRKKFAIALAVIQTVLIVLYAMYSRFSDDPAVIAYMEKLKLPTDHLWEVGNHYAAFQDVQLMVIIGFALMAAFLKRYTQSGIGYNLLIAAIAIQWGIFFHEIILTRARGVLLGVQSLITGNFAATAVLVSFGAVLGKFSPYQLLFMTMIEIVFYTINKYIGHMIYQASDAGHCMYVHLFGALFGLFASRMNLKTFHRTHPQQARTYQSDIWTIIGTLFLWICFPSFNAAFSTEMLRQRALINTLFALLASTLSTFIFTVFVSTDGKFGVTHAQNAVLAGGVAISATASTICHPWVSLVIGVVAGMLAVFSIEYKQKCILDKAGFHDTRFVLSLHAVPAFFGAIMSMVVSGMATENSIGKLNLYQAYPAMTPDDSTNDTLIHSWVRMGKVNFSDGRSGGDQARYQMYTLLTTMLISIIGGAITGLLLSFKWCDMPTAENAFDDGDQWAVAEEGMASFEAYIPVPHAVEMVERSVVADDTVELKKNEMTNEEEIEEVKKDGNGTTPIESDH